MNKLTCHYSIISYLADPLRNEPRNIGVLMRAPDLSLHVAFHSQLSAKLRGVAKSADFQFIHAFMEDVQGLAHGQSELLQTTFRPEDPKLLTLLASQRFGRIKFTEPRGVLAENVPAELLKLKASFVEDAEPQARPKQTRLKTELKKELQARNLLQGSSKVDKAPRFRMDVTLKGGRSKLDHEVDAAYVNGHVYVVETVDLRPQQQEAEHAACTSAIKIDDVKLNYSKSSKWGSGIAVVAFPRNSDQPFDRELSLLRSYCEKVFVYNSVDDRKKLLNQLEEIVHQGEGELI